MARTEPTGPSSTNSGMQEQMFGSSQSGAPGRSGDFRPGMTTGYSGTNASGLSKVFGHSHSLPSQTSSLTGHSQSGMTTGQTGVPQSGGYLEDLIPPSETTGSSGLSGQGTSQRLESDSIKAFQQHPGSSTLGSSKQDIQLPTGAGQERGMAPSYERSQELGAMGDRTSGSSLTKEVLGDDRQQQSLSEPTGFHGQGHDTHSVSRRSANVPEGSYLASKRQQFRDEERQA